MRRRLLLAVELLLGGGLHGLHGEHGSVEAGGVGLRAQRLLDGLLGAKQPAKEVLQDVDNVVEQRRHENLLRQVDDPHADVGEEVLEAGVDDEGVHGLVEPGSVLDNLEEGVQVLEHAEQGVGDGLAELVERQVGDGLAGVLEELATSLQQANGKVDVAGKVEETNALVLGVGGERAGGQAEHGRVLGHELLGVLGSDLKVSGLDSGRGSGESSGRHSGKGNGGKLHSECGSDGGRWMREPERQAAVFIGASISCASFAVLSLIGAPCFVARIALELRPEPSGGGVVQHPTWVDYGFLCRFTV